MNKELTTTIKEVLPRILETITIKGVSFLIFAVIFFCTTFGILNAKITDGTLTLALMLLLLTLFSDLKKFNFWGLTGEKIEKNLKDLQGKSGVNEKAIPNPTPKQVYKAETVELDSPFEQDESYKGNFLTIAYALERLLRVISIVLEEREVPSDEVLDVLQSKKLLKSVGVEQIEIIRKLKELLLKGKYDEVNEVTIRKATELASNLYSELNHWLKNQE